jgi:hypothetical protein
MGMTQRFAFHVLGHRFEKVAVIAACQTTVSGDHNTADLFYLPLLNKGRVKFRVAVGNVGKGLVKSGKVGPGSLRPFLSPS